MRTAKILLLLFLLVAAVGCDEQDQEKWRAYQRQIQAEQQARAEADRRLAQERQARDREKQVADLQVQQESRKSTMGTTIAVGSVCLATVVIFLLARERRIRNVLVTALRWLVERRSKV